MGNNWLIDIKIAQLRWALMMSAGNKFWSDIWINEIKNWKQYKESSNGLL